MFRVQLTTLKLRSRVMHEGQNYRYSMRVSLFHSLGIHIALNGHVWLNVIAFRLPLRVENLDSKWWSAVCFRIPNSEFRVIHTHNDGSCWKRYPPRPNTPMGQSLSRFWFFRFFKIFDLFITVSSAHKWLAVIVVELFSFNSTRATPPAFNYCIVFCILRHICMLLSISTLGWLRHYSQHFLILLDSPTVVAVRFFDITSRRITLTPSKI